MHTDSGTQQSEPGPLHNAKRAYRAPTLVLYGDVRVLTQAGGSLTPVEVGNNSTSCANGPNGAGHALPCTPSDRRLKEQIVRIGTHPLGMGLYLFDYKAGYAAAYGTGRQFGVMADEVEAVAPEAVVVDASGFKAVRYDLLGIRQHLH